MVVPEYVVPSTEQHLNTINLHKSYYAQTPHLSFHYPNPHYSDFHMGKLNAQSIKIVTNEHTEPF